MNRQLICILALLASALPAWSQTKVEPAEPPPMRFESVREGPAESCRDRCREWISASGRITADTPRDFEAFARTRNIRGATIVLDSNGGVALAGIALGRSFRNLGLTTTVGKTTLLSPAGEGQPRATLSPRADCASMCAFVLLGGTRRHVPAEAQVLVHQLWLKDRTEDAAAASYSAEQVVRIQREVGLIARYIIEMGGDIELFETAMRVPPWERLRPLTVAELNRMRLHTSDSAFSVKPSVASVSPQPGPGLRPAAPTGDPLGGQVRIHHHGRNWRGVATALGRSRSVRRARNRSPQHANHRGRRSRELQAFVRLRLYRGDADHHLQRDPQGAGPRARRASSVRYHPPDRQRGRAVAYRVSVQRALGLNSIARGTLTVKVLKEFAEGKTRSLLVATRMTDDARTAIRVGNTGLVTLLDQVATRCAQPARPS